MTETTCARSARGQPAPTGQPSANHINDDNAQNKAIRVGAQRYLSNRAISCGLPLRESELRFLGRMAAATEPANKRDKRGLNFICRRLGISRLVPMEELDG